MRAARVDIVIELLPVLAPVLRDHGLKIIGIQNAPAECGEVVRLIVEGWMLPDACERAEPLDAPLVTMMFTQEVYGTQRIVKLSAIDLVPNKRVAAA